jgi:hypothetical protein
MAFTDPPYVDKNSERCEESVLKTRSIFSKKNGFITREVNADDYGVDLYGELIINNGASAQFFPIQIKSTQKAQLIYKGSKSYLTLSFSTSRLGYLYKDLSYSGLIVFYDKSSENLYYDFVINILNQILLDRKDTKWMAQDKVTIAFPEDNLLDNNRIREIHKIISLRFEKIQQAIYDSQNRIDLGFPLLENRSINQSEDRSREIVSALEKIGPVLFNERRYPELTEYLEQLPKKYIDKPQMAYLAALVYTENGNVLSADYFLKLCERYKKFYSEKEWEALLLQRSRTDFLLGHYTNNELLAKLKALKAEVSSTENSMNLEININQFQLVEAIHSLEIDEELYNKTNEIYARIEDLDINAEQKNFQILFQTDNLVGAIFPKLLNSLNDRRLYERVHPSFIKNNQEKLELINVTFERVFKKINEVHDFAERYENKLLLASAYDRIAKVSLNLDLCYFFLDMIPSDIDDLKRSLEGMISYQLKAYNLYKSLSVLPEAFTVLNMAYETHRLSKEWIDYNLDEIVTLSKIKSEISSFDSESFAKRFNSVVDQITNDRKLGTLNGLDNALNESQIEMIAQKIIGILNLPPDRFENVKNEIESIEFFKSNCKNKDLVLLTNQEDPFLGENKYRFPSKFAIANEKTNVIYAEGYDVKEMLMRLSI